MIKIEKWYFTFGCGQRNAGYVQPIVATDFRAARRKMIDVYGIEWCAQYSEKQWENIRNDKNRFWDMEEELPEII